MLVSKDNFLFTCPKQWALRRNTGAKCATKRIKHAKRDAPSWLAAGLKLRKPSLCIYHNSFRGLSICRIQRRCLEGEARSTISNAGREKREQGKARWKGVRYSRIAQCLDSFFFFFFKCCSNYTLFHVLRQNLHVKCCNLFPFYRCHAPPPKKSRSWFAFNESHLAQEFASTQFLLRLRLHRNVFSKLKYCLSVHFGGRSLSASCPCLLKGFLSRSLSVDFRTVTTCFHFFSPGNTRRAKEKRPFKSIFPSATRQGWLRPH